jgi:hypothetical protein
VQLETAVPSIAKRSAKVRQLCVFMKNAQLVHVVLPSGVFSLDGFYFATQGSRDP